MVISSLPLASQRPSLLKATTVTGLRVISKRQAAGLIERCAQGFLGRCLAWFPGFRSHIQGFERQQQAALWKFIESRLA